MNNGKCDFCSKKLKIIFYSCDCNQKFCEKHRYRHSHNCSVDTQSKQKENIKKMNQQIKATTVTTI